MQLVARTLAGLLATAVIGALIWWSLARAAPEAQAAAGLLGERWYQLTLANDPVGYYRAHSQRLRDGRYQFATELRFALAADQPVTVQDAYVFDGSPPFALQLANHRVVREGIPASVSVYRKEDALVSQRTSAASKVVEPAQPLSWQYALGDYLAFEAWLRQRQPDAGASITVRSPNLETLEMSAEVFELLAHDGDGYQIRKRSLLDATVIELNDQLIPTRFELAGVFDLTLSTREQALAARSPLQKASYRIPLDQPLRNHTALTRLELRISGADAGRFPESLTLTDNPLVAVTGDSYLESSIDHPVDHPRLRETLAQLALEGLTVAEQVQRLLRYVHQFVKYDDSVPSQPVLALLDSPIGDCTEYADLFTTLARTARVPARTVIGMAYTDAPEPALAFHAWNQVRIDGVWQAVDPTWNQSQVDATHWPLPTDAVQAMLLLTGQVDVTMEVLETSYEPGSEQTLL
ncbi:MAG: transglutaminase family protein [Pseudomonadales bacterium]